MGKLYTCAEVAERYGVTVNTVWGWVRSKQLCAIKISGSKGLRVSEEDMTAFENSRRTIQPEANA